MVRQSRRRFLTTLSLTGAAALLPRPGVAVAAEGPPETRSVRLPKEASICVAPQDVVDDLLRGEGFTDIGHVPLALDTYVPDAISRGELDFGMNFATVQIAGIDRGVAMKVLAGVHVGCFELFVNDAIGGITNLGGKKVGIRALGSPGAPVRVRDCRQCRHRSKGADRVGHERSGPPETAVHRRQNRCVPRLSARASRGACKGSAGFPSTARSIARISAVSWPAAPSTSQNIRSQPSACCARC
jgi:hypothetical protein